MKDTNLSRRTFVGGIATCVGGLASTTTVAARGKPSRSARITFKKQDAFVGPENPGPMEAAVLTEDVHMPDGGWVLLKYINGDPKLELDDPFVGGSISKLPAGHFRNLRVAVSALAEGDHVLAATLFKGETIAEIEPYITENGKPVAEIATIKFP